MFYLNIRQNQNGSHDYVQTSVAIKNAGWIALPTQYEPLLPFLTVTTNADGTYCFADNPEARVAQEAADAEHTADVPPTTEEQLRADVDFLAVMQGVTL
jgi:hypothetical protein